MNGSVRRRSKNSWELRIDPGRDPEGKRKRKFVHVTGTKGEAQRKLRELLSSLDKGIPLDVSRATVGQFLERWLTDYAETNTGPPSVEGYREKIQAYVIPHLGNVPLGQLIPQHVQSLYSEMLGRELSARTVLHAQGYCGKLWDMQ